MLCSFLPNTSHWAPLLSNSVWRKSLSWLQKKASTADLGTYPLGRNDWYANVHEYRTRDQQQCVWESHQHTIDIQYIITGCEKILWMPTSDLIGPTKSFINIDRQEWKTPIDKSKSSSQLHLSPGFFAIFLPNEGHCPMIRVTYPTLIRKAVIKIPVCFLSDG